MGGIIFINREKKEEALRALCIIPVTCEEIIRQIEKEYYSHNVIDERSY